MTVSRSVVGLRRRSSEVERFWSYVIKGPDPMDCWLWMGAIADDGYGRFWTRTAEGTRVVRPQRFAFELITGRMLSPATMLLHSCDIPICVHTEADLQRSHVVPGTARQNMRDCVQKGRHENGATSWRPVGQSRLERVQRSRDLRTAIIEHGWVPERISAALAGVEDTHPRLF